MQPPKACFFDVFGTLVDWRNSIARESEAILKPLGHKLDWLAFADAWRKRYQPAMEECRSGRRAFTRLDVLHRENLENVLRDNGLDPVRIGEAELDTMNRAWHRLDPWPEAVAGLTRLRRRYVLAPISNGNVALLGDPSRKGLISLDNESFNGEKLDVVFPALHGTYGEDGTLQGLLEMADVPYVGCGVAASATGMDKVAMKRAFRAEGLPVTDYVVTNKEQTAQQRKDLVAGLKLLDHDEPGFWERNGYHDRGEPWLEQRYQGD